MRRTARTGWVVVATAGTVAVTATIVVAATGVSSSSEASGQVLVAGESGIGTPAPEAARSTTVAAVNRSNASQSNRLRRSFDIATKKNVFFITIDDGNVKSSAALALVRKFRIPVTVFLTNAAINGNSAYFKRITAFGGTVENHTMNHRVLPSLNSAALRYEVCGPQGRYRQMFAHKPTMLRPPYGEGGYTSSNSSSRRRIDQVATSCGLRHMVMWNALADRGKFQFIRGSLHRGDIVLFHFTSDLARELKRVLVMGVQKGLRPAPLQDYLK